MKADRKLYALGLISLMMICLCEIGFEMFKYNKPKNQVKEVVVNNPKVAKDIAVILDTVKTDEKKEEKTEAPEEVSVEETTAVVEEKKEEEVVVAQPEPVKPAIVYDGLTLDELAAKLNRSLNSNLSGYGYKFASRSLELGVDPYLAVAIVLHETGCTWSCSNLVINKNNVGGMVSGGSYIAFASLDEGIDAFLSNLYRNYYAYGLTTPEQINTKYATSTTWSEKINYYINKIRAN